MHIYFYLYTFTLADLCPRQGCTASWESTWILGNFGKTGRAIVRQAPITVMVLIKIGFAIKVWQ
ncbi:hypothetical protein ABEB36_015428 [Hypothenemus hampei]|uniref:Uncharacterized protein n=1 Tax=Hypothenemus hampei TaxID=57062 RepID=A0ABD1E0G6_HYPHA